MNLLKRVWDEFVLGGHLLAVGNSSIVLAVLLLLDLQINIQLLAIPYLMTQAIYSYNHFKEAEFDLNSNPERATYNQSQSKWAKTIFLVYLSLLVVFTLTTNFPTIVIVVTIIMGGALYTVYFKEIVSKSITGLKSAYVSFFWTLLIFLPISYYKLNISEFYLYFFIFVFIRGFCNTAFFDIKDIESDKSRGLKTLPVRFGKKGTTLILLLLNIFVLVPLVLGIINNKLPLIAIFLGLLSMYSILYILSALYMEGKNLRNLSYVIADGEYMVWPIVIILGIILM